MTEEELEAAREEVSEFFDEVRKDMAEEAVGDGGDG